MRIKSFLIGAMVLILGVASASAQAGQQVQVIPPDPDVRVGKLENGMTYYLRHNAKPAEMAEFYIFHNVGAIQEEDSQIGLAHFLEHMAFNGTTNLPGKQLINWLETIGVKFGSNLNAATGVEMTYYNMSQVPLKRESIIDSALLILHDWSHFIALEGDEIDNERGVIIEELRQGNNARSRIGDKTRPVLYNGNKYSFRNIIGTEEQLRTFSHQEIRDFYHRWYRPDLQTLVIVGDFDVDKMEARIKKVMADIPAVQNPEDKQYFPIPDNQEPLVTVATDPEVTGSSVGLYIKRPSIPHELNSSIPVYFMNYALAAATSLTSQRLSEIAQKPDAPFMGARFQNGSMSVTNDALVGSVSARDGEIPRAFEAFYTEIERVRRYGFSESELERFKTNAMESSRQAYLKREDRRSADFVWTYIGNFVSNSPMPSAETDWQIDSVVISSLSLDMVNKIISELIIPNNNVLIVTAPEKAGVSVPTADEMLALIYKVREADIAPYEDTVIDEPLISHDIKPGTVKKTEKGMYESTIWTLSNGVRVILKPTDLRKEQVSMAARADGGTSVLSDDDFRSASAVMGVIGMSGLGKFSNTELRKILTGKVASAEPSLGRFSSGISGGSSRKDIETMLQLTYLYFTEPRINKDDFDRMMNNLREQLLHQESTPDFKLQQEATKTIYGNHFRAQNITLETMGDIKFEKMAGIYDKFFKDKADEYTFYFIGDFDLEQIKPLIEKYLGSLPAGKDKLKSKDDGLAVKRGEITNRFKAEMQAPMTTVMFLYSGDIAYTQENNMVMSLLSNCLSNRYLESIREEKGGTYGVSVRGGLGRQPKQTYSMQISFQTDPNMVDELLDIVEDEIRNIAENGPRQEDMSKTIEHWIKTRPESLKENGTWLGYLSTYYTWGEDWNVNYDAILKSMDGQKVQELARKILKDGNLIKIIMDPEK